MKSKFGFFFTIVATFLIATTACTINDQNVTSTGSSSISIRIEQVAASSTGITISWIDDKGDNKSYTLSVYSDAECTNLYQQYELTFDEMDDKRFSIPYLDTDRPYYIVIKNIKGCKSKPFEVSLSTDHIRSEVISHNFDNLFWGYDYINSANGVKLSGDIKPKQYDIEKLTDAIADSQPTTSINDNGGLLSDYKESMRKLMGFEGWPASTETYILPGYIKLGSAKGVGILRTPALSALENESVNIEISFNAAIFSNTLSANGGRLNLSVLKGDGTTLKSKDFNLKGINGRPSWNNCSFTVEGVTSDCYCEIKTYDATKQVCLDNLKIVRKLNIPEGYIYGYTYDKATGKPISDVAVSDGFTVVTTNKDGLYMLRPSTDAWYVFYSIPANCQVVRHLNGPLFFTRITKDTKEYNFELRLLPDGKKEEKFALLTFADPQVSSSTGLNRFTKEAIPAIKAYAKELSAEMPVYGITLGDVISTGTSDADQPKNNTRGDATQYMEKMREAMRPSTVGFPIFQVMGNHDCNYFGVNCPLVPDAQNSTYNIKAQRDFESTFGPINYSFNRGDVHIVGMRDIYYSYDNTTRSYKTGFMKEQYEWLKQDLAVVPKDKMVVLCVHIPLFGSVTKSGESGHYVKEVHQLLNEFQEAHVISGHTHYQRNYIHTNYNIYEHNMGTVCGTWWSSNICGDGTPNGYGVFIGEGNTFTDWYYMGYHEGMNTRQDQMRLYRGSAITGAPRQSKNGTNGTGYYAYNFGDDVILANVYMADKNWTIEVYEDEVKTGEMTLVEGTYSFDNMVGNYTMDDPRQIKDGTTAAYDMWAVGIQVGELNRVGSNGSWVRTYHLYQYKLKNPAAKVSVKAIDPFGNQYTSDKFVDYSDNKMGKKPQL